MIAMTSAHSTIAAFEKTEPPREALRRGTDFAAQSAGIDLLVIFQQDFPRQVV